jgi:hypothetical protein
VRGIRIECLRCRHVGSLTEPELIQRGIKPDAPIVSFVKRLRCRKCGSGSVRAERVIQKKASYAALRKGRLFLHSVTLIKNRRVGVIWNVFMASATADFSSGASTVPMRLPRKETRHLAIEPPGIGPFVHLRPRANDLVFSYRLNAAPEPQAGNGHAS